MILQFPTVTHVYDNAGVRSAARLGAQREMSSGKRDLQGLGEAPAGLATVVGQARRRTHLRAWRNW